MRTTLPDGRRVIGFRKTLARRAARTPAYLLPDWQLSFFLPAYVGFGVPTGRIFSVIGARLEPSGRIVVCGKNQQWVIAQARLLLSILAPDGLIEPIEAVIERADEAGPTLSGPIRKGERRTVRLAA